MIIYVFTASFSAVQMQYLYIHTVTLTVGGKLNVINTYPQPSVRRASLVSKY